MRIDRLNTSAFFVRDRSGKVLALGCFGSQPFLLAQTKRVERDGALVVAIERLTGVSMRRHEYILHPGKSALRARLYPLDRILTNTECMEWFQAHKITPHNAIQQVERDGRLYMRVPELRWKYGRLAEIAA